MAQNSEKVDRLSNLPNELIDLIFDYAYSYEYPSTVPLSKRLLPFHATRLYEAISLESLDGIAKLVDTIKRKPNLGRHVKRARLHSHEQDSYCAAGIAEADIKRFFKNLANLEELDLGSPFNGSFKHLSRGHFDLIPAEHLPSLEFLSIPGNFDLDRLPAFPALVSLEVVFNSDKGGNEVCIGNCTPEDNPAIFQKLEYLSIEGSFQEYHAERLPRFFNLQPALTRLDLSFKRQGNWEPFPWAKLVAQLPATLTTLCLDDELEISDTIDHLLPRFSQLEFLCLGSSFTYQDLPSHLVHLRALEKLFLHTASIPTTAFVRLLSGANQLPNLNELWLCYDDEEKWEVGVAHGQRLLINGNKLVGIDLGSRHGKLTLGGGDWELPSWKGDEGTLFSRSGGKAVIEAAKKSDIELKGELFEAVENAEKYLLEVANVAIYRSYRDKDFRHIVRLRQHYPELSERLPPLDLDSLDPTKLKLVKTELPEEEWFSLTLENEE